MKALLQGAFHLGERARENGGSRCTVSAIESPRCKDGQEWHGCSAQGDHGPE